MDRNAWRTPPEIFAALNAEFDFKIDVAATEENALLDWFIPPESNALISDWIIDGVSKAGDYAWCNPPYSDIGPWIDKASEQSKLGLGVVMLVMADTSVGWYKKAIETCQEVRFITGGRLSFLDPVGGKPVGGNNKGSLFLIWHPFAKGKLVVSHVDRDSLIAAGLKMLKGEQC